MVLKGITRFLQALSSVSRSLNEPIWQGIGPVRDFVAHEWGVVFHCANGSAILQWLNHDVIKLKFQFYSPDLDATLANTFDKNESAPFSIIDVQDAVEVHSSSLICRVDKSSFCLSLKTLEGHLLCRDTGGMQMQVNGALRLSMLLQAEESSYGLGAYGEELNLRGQRLLFQTSEAGLNTHHFNNRQQCSIPFYLGVHEQGVYGVFWEKLQSGFIDIGATKADERVFETESQELCYFLFAGLDVKSIFNRYTELIGRIDLPPVRLFDQRPNSRQPEVPNEVADRRQVKVVNYGQFETKQPETSDREQSDWDYLCAYIVTALNVALAGSTMSAPKADYFHPDMSAECYVRWLQTMCLMPVSFSRDVEKTLSLAKSMPEQPHATIILQTTELRYQFSPYLYSIMALCHEYGWPVIQPLFVAEQKNPHIRDIGDCFLLGEAVLVAPVVTKNANVRDVFLPSGEWYDYWTGELLRGSRTVSVSALLERLPLFMKAGSVLAMWSDKMDDSENETSSMTYRIYPGKAETVLYEDVGDGYDYQKGDYRWVYVSCEQESDRLLIKRRLAGRYMPKYQQIRLEIVGLSAEPAQVRVDRQGAPIWFFDDGMLEMTVDDKFQHIEVKM